MSTRNIITSLFLALTLVAISLPAAAQSDSVSKPISEVVHNTWTNGAPMPTGVNWPAVGVIKGKIYVVGGYAGSAPGVTDNQVFNPATSGWSSAAPIPAATSQAAAAVVKNVMYVFGGSNNGGGTVFNTVWAYNPKTNTWASKAAMPTARCSAVAVVANNIIYVIGGYNGSRLNTVEAYNPASNTWVEAAQLLLGKSEISGGLFGTAKTGFTIVAADGFSGSDTGDTEAYNVSTNKWTSLASDPNGRNGSCFGVVAGKLLASDGNSSGNSPIAVMESFNLKKNVWKSLAAMPNTVTDSGSAVYKGKLYCIGGGDWAVPPNNNVYNYMQIYQP